MKRFVQVAAVACVAALGLAGQAAAQPVGDRPLSVQVNGGVASGSGLVSVEGDWIATSKFTVFAELGHIGNVAPGFITDRANFVASVIGGSADVKDKATYFDVGVKYMLPMLATHYQPYAGFAVGFAHVAKDTTISVNGSDLSEDQLLNDYGVQLGSDLAGSTNKATTTIVLGVQRAIGQRYGVDVAYRYSRIFPKTDIIESDKGINVNGIQVGFLVRF